MWIASRNGINTLHLTLFSCSILESIQVQTHEDSQMDSDLIN